MSKKTKFAAGAVVGAIAGIIAGVLTAPKSGKETRADIRVKAVELKAKSKNRAKKIAKTPVERGKGHRTKKS